MFEKLKSNLLSIPTAIFCRRINKENSIKNKTQTRDKKQAIKAILISLDRLDKLGFKVSIEPKK